jgi:hypothetical protein
LAINAEQRCWDEEQIAENVLAISDLVLVGISCGSERTYATSKKIAKLIKQKRPKIHIIVGGILATTADEELINDCQYFDSVCRGEGEFVITELAYKLIYGLDIRNIRGLTIREPDGTIKRNQKRSRIVNLDLVSFPIRNEMEFNKLNNIVQPESAYILGSRGCYGDCSFCSLHYLYGSRGVVSRTPESIVDELAHVKKNYGVNQFWFVDDTFFMPSKKGLEWLDDFCVVLKKRDLNIGFHIELRGDSIQASTIRKLEEVGLNSVFIGVESGCDSMLQRWNKGLTVKENERAIKELEALGWDKNRIDFGYIMFDPAMTLEELRQNYLWVRNSGHCRVQHLQNRLNIYYGTQSYQQMVDKYGLTPPYFGNRWNYPFIHKSVGDFHKIFRENHDYIQNALLDGYIPSQVKYLEVHNVLKKQNNLHPKFVLDALESICRYFNNLEREIYYYIFDILLDNLDKIPIEQLEKYVRTFVSFRCNYLNNLSKDFQRVLDHIDLDNRTYNMVEGPKIEVFDKTNNLVFIVDNKIMMIDRYSSNVFHFEEK